METQEAGRERSGDPGWTSSQGLHSSIHMELTSVLSFAVSLNITLLQPFY